MGREWHCLGLMSTLSEGENSKGEGEKKERYRGLQGQKMLGENIGKLAGGVLRCWRFEPIWHLISCYTVMIAHLPAGTSWQLPQFPILDFMTTRSPKRFHAGSSRDQVPKGLAS